ncbi:putative ABC transport system permease protein [Phycicoccus badiiscoriae]|uniref:Putative ABC transport system permease protein n=1 Tax=Pedococcus badiiscoriae TaxID=642776 RepID=A0A852WD67_9MICO|nr:ABC transporter permease [Pedococcus badiiscoriae]NYG07217.1 putative ABC transport system permease protein [Pedococcus badiiscoriae]
MLRASWKSLMGRKLRLFMSGFAIILGVSFVSGSLIFTDTLGKAFSGIVDTVGDVVVRPASVNGNFDSAPSSATLPGSMVRSLASVPGVARVDGNVSDPTTFVVSTKGKLIGGQGAPGLGLSWNDAPTASGEPPAHITRGRSPHQKGEVVLDAGTAERAGYRIGDVVTLATSSPTPIVRATLVGLAEFKSGLVGATLTFFDTKTAQGLYLGGKDEYTDAWVTAKDGVSQKDLAKAVQARLPAGYQAVTGEAVAKESQNSINKALSFINTFLLVFAGIALFVGSFLIINTFSILVAQRSRELALFRALGAARRQVTRSVLFEAFVVGLVGSTVGLGLGFVLALGIKALFAQFGLDLTGSPLVFQWPTAMWSYAVGLLVTMVAAYLPARRAGRMPPVAAMRDDVALPESALRWRLLVGGVLMVGGLVAGYLGAFTSVDNSALYVGGGVFGLLLGVALTSPVIGRPVIAACGLVYRRLFGTVGVMAEQNAIRNPRRTAATASALMIGLTLVSMMSVFGASAKASVDKSIADNFVADYVVSNAIGQPFSSSITTDVAKVPGVEVATPVRYTVFRKGGDRQFAAAVDPATFARAVPIEVLHGTLSSLTGNTIMLTDKSAKALGLGVGDTVKASIAAGKPATYTVVAIYRSMEAMDIPVLTSIATATANGRPQQDSLTFVVRQPGADKKAIEAGIDKVIADLPTVTLKDQNAFAAEQRAPIDQLLYLIYALLGLAVVIAVLGIVNTLALSVIERTREIGLLRAVGLSRRQLRTMLRLESVAIALLGAVLGVVLGLAAGWGLQRSLADSGITVLAIPVPQLAIFVVLAGVVGVLAALWPGRRASRLDVLKAITTE